MNKKRMPYGIAAAALALFIVLALDSCQSTLYKWANVIYRGEETPFLEGTSWTCTESSGKKTTIQFRSGGVLVFGNNSIGYYWERIDSTVRMVVGFGSAYLEGTYYPETKKILGSGENSGGTKWEWTMELLAGFTLPNQGRIVDTETPSATPAPVLPERTVNVPETSSSALQGIMGGALESACRTLIEKLPANSRIAVLNVSSSNPDDSEYAVDEIEYRLVNSGRFTVVDRRRLDQIRSEQNFQMSGDVDDDSAISIGNMLGADIVLTGNISRTQWLNIRALDVKTAQIITMAREQF